MDAQHVLAQQAELYGEPLGTRFGRILQALAISQTRLAAVMGLSAPMLSQLASGHRVKISNPAVYGRMLRLEHLAASGPDQATVARELEAIAASQPTLTADLPVDPREFVQSYLARTAPESALRAAAGACDGALHDLLAAAAAHAAR